MKIRKKIHKLFWSISSKTMSMQESNNPKLIAMALAFSGAAALIYELVGSEVLYFYFSSSTYSVATVLAVFLFGLGLGSWAITKFLKKIKRKALVFATFQIIIALYAFLVLANFNIVPKLLYFFNSLNHSNNLFFDSIGKFLSGSIFLFLPTLLFGASFPLAVSIIIKKIKEAGVNVGFLYSWDLFGSVGGAIIAGFLLIPFFGLKMAIGGAVVFNFLSAFLVLRGKKKKAILISLFIPLLSIFLITNAGNDIKLEAINESSIAIKNSTILFQKPSPYGLITVTIDSDSRKLLNINNRSQCYTLENKDDMSERMISDITLSLLTSQKESDDFGILNIGLGCGLTLNNLLKSTRVRSIDVVEINPVVAEAAKFFASENQNALDDLRVNLIIEDGFQFIKENENKYDAIVIDIENPKIAHSSPLYTLEFFEAVDQRINEGGVLALWGYSGSYEYKKTLFFTLKGAFQYVYPISLEGHMLFFASQNELEMASRIMNSNDHELFDRLVKEKKIIINTLNNPVLKSFFPG